MKREAAQFFNAKSYGASLKEVAVDYLDIEDQKITSRWYKSDFDTDLYVWTDHRNRIIKQQITVLGRVVEWNILDGVKTGLVIETEMSLNAAEKSEEICFDKNPERKVIEMVVDLLTYAQSVGALPALVSNFRSNELKRVPLEEMSPFRRLVSKLRAYFSEE